MLSVRKKFLKNARQWFIYINDLPHAIQDSNVFVYADDTSLCFQSNYVTQLNDAIDNDFKRMDSWLQDNTSYSDIAKHTPCYLLLSKDIGFLKIGKKF